MSRVNSACTANVRGQAKRALFVIDADGIIRWSHVSPVGINPGADGILGALENLERGENHEHRQ
jgi:alkyl hydroperoxide reductase subunit AhpC